MDIAKPLLFTTIFLLSRVPIWLVLYVAILTSPISIRQGIIIALILSICKSFINFELLQQPMIRYYTSNTIRIILTLIIAISFYLVAVVYVLLADEVTKLLIIVAAFLTVLIFYKTDKNSGQDRYLQYEPPLATRIITTISWLYVAFANDSSMGIMLMVFAIILIELYQLKETGLANSIAFQKN